MVPGESPLVAFISSVMDAEMEPVRADAVAALQGPAFLMPWAFEFTPASSDPADWSYLEKIRRADVVIWLSGTHMTEPVRRELQEARTHGVRLIAIRVAAEEVDEATADMIANIGIDEKWIVIHPSEVRDAVALSLGDELVRAWRTKPGRSRQALLEVLGRESRARCIRRWRAAGLSRFEALELADDLTIGTPPAGLAPDGDRPFRVVVGEVGAGKSLFGERLLQQAVIAALSDPNASVPVWLSAKAAAGNLRAHVENAAKDIGTPARCGATVIIDGADEAGSAAAQAVVDEARGLIELWPNVRITLTTRPIHALGSIDELTPLPPLDLATTIALVSNVANTDASRHQYGWPESVKDAIKRPLFAILVGLWIRDRGGSPRSTGELLRFLVERAVPDVDEATETQLRQLARLATDREDAPVPAQELGDRRLRRPVLDSGLVVEARAGVSFGLPVLTQWFAAQSLLASDPAIQSLTDDPARLDLWRYALIIAISDASSERATEILAPLVAADPAFASQVVREATRANSSGEAPGTALDDLSVGHLIRDTTAHWISGLRPASLHLGLTRPDGTPLPLGCSVHDGRVTAMWRQSDDVNADVVRLPPAEHILRHSEGWGPGRFATPSTDPAWPWRWSLDEIAGQLGPRVKGKQIFLQSGPALAEAVWAAALAVTGSGSLRSKALDLDTVRSALATIPEDVEFLRTPHGLYAVGSLRDSLTELAKQDRQALECPNPGPDLDLHTGGWVWSSYSREALLDRVSTVYRNAISIYAGLIEQWLPSAAPRLQMYALFPALFHGELIFHKPREGFDSGPTLSWGMEPLSADLQSDVRVTLVQEGAEPAPWMSQTEWNTRQKLVRTCRPQSRRWLSPIAGLTSVDVFRATPATDLAFDWLHADLKKVDLV